MNLAAKIQKTSADPRKWIGRRSRECRKHGNSIHYVNPTGQIGCIECDQPADSRVLLRLCAHDGVWYDSNNGFSDSGPQQATQKLRIGQVISEDGRKYQVMPVDDDGNPITWYDYDESHGKEPGMKWETYVYLKWVMREFNASGPEFDNLEFRYGKRR